jgi:hypothetical protein
MGYIEWISGKRERKKKAVLRYYTMMVCRENGSKTWLHWMEVSGSLHALVFSPVRI